MSGLPGSALRMHVESLSIASQVVNQVYFIYTFLISLDDFDVHWDNRFF